MPIRIIAHFGSICKSEWEWIHTRIKFDSWYSSSLAVDLK